MNEATRLQHLAAEPESSTWLAANAGTGKTRVLTDRVARLLLAGVLPQNVLCLTYTRAAASEMQNRLFQTLGGWAMLGDAELAQALAALGVRPAPVPPDLARARTLFARAIETPGGLRVQTIHAFCAALLRRFPLEAGVTPAFTEIDEAAQCLLLDEVLEELAIGPQAALIDGLAEWTDAIAEVVTSVAAHRDDFRSPLDRDGAWRLFGLAPGYDVTALTAEVFGPDVPALLRRVADACAPGTTPNDLKLCNKLRRLDLARPSLADLERLEEMLLHGKGAKTNPPFSAKIGVVPGRDTRTALGADAEALDALMRRVEVGRERRLALGSAERTAALHAFAAAFLPLYERRKRRAGLVDYEDLILKARRLLSDPSVADWVLYRLDGGIDHILVDEAQDTSPAQWDVIERLAREFAAGRGARDDAPRTIFVVGDVKQSIYSFQGADPAAFDRMRESFARALRGNLQHRELRHSFRSSRAILETVDAVADGLPGLEADVRHEAFHPTLPGRVDLWPVVPPAEPRPRAPWSDPVDLPSPDDASVVLARRIAEWLGNAVEGETPIPDRLGRLRPLRPGDVLILVQRRNALFREIIRTLKARGLEVAGADRLKLSEELAVRDLLALCAFLALPEDDLALATALRSPLFGWSEDDLHRLAYGRPGYLWQALRGSAERLETVAMLRDLLDAADFERPYELLERILVRHDGRGRLLARLGEEAEDGIDELLNKALDYETAAVPSLTGFLTWIEAEDVEVKRQADAAGDRVRVMTVHGAKGLEAPLVILPDSLRAEAALRDPLVLTSDGVPCWRNGGRSADCALVALSRSRREEADAEERNRLLYVAMTRARTWLVICGAGMRKGATWYDRIEAALKRLGVPHRQPTGDGWRHEHGDWSGPTLPWTAPNTRAAAEVSDAPVMTPARRRPRSASDLGGAKSLPGEGLETEAALDRGTRLHLLLEHLAGAPPEARMGIAARLGEADGELFAEATGVLDAPRLAAVFAEGALIEVEVRAALPDLDGEMLHGTMDRLIVGQDRVLCVDFKTNLAVPARPEHVPNGLLRQMGAYAAALGQIYPGRRVETAILWTRTAELMSLPDELVRAALLDAARGGS